MIVFLHSDHVSAVCIVIVPSDLWGCTAYGDVGVGPQKSSPV